MAGRPRLVQGTFVPEPGTTTDVNITQVGGAPVTGGKVPVTEADGDNVALGAKADAAATTDSGTFSLISLFKRLLVKFTTGISTKITDGVDTAEVNARTDGIVALEVADDMTSFESFTQSLVADADTTFTFTQPVRLVKVKNFSTSATTYVRDGAIASSTPSNAELVGVAPTINVPAVEYFPFKTSTIHLRSAGAPQICVTGFY